MLSLFSPFSSPFTISVPYGALMMLFTWIFDDSQNGNISNPRFIGASAAFGSRLAVP